MSAAQTRFFTLYSSPLGPLLLLSDGEALTGLYMNERIDPPAGEQNDHAAPFTQVRQQLDEYFAGTRTRFDLPLNLQGTVFQQRVWGQLQEIPYGITWSYGELAKRLGDAKASRAVGLANGRNPVSIIVPCHRVIGANGSLTGYGGGLSNKQTLLDFERINLAQGPVPLAEAVLPI
ncbi:MAG: methylated-DNA--[protein]-cysteine S-methyltransferase [Armatimonadaceae bacterium]